jgi:hypothetical protein
MFDADGFLCVLDGLDALLRLLLMSIPSRCGQVPRLGDGTSQLLSTVRSPGARRFVYSDRRLAHDCLEQAAPGLFNWMVPKTSAGRMSAGVAPPSPDGINSEEEYFCLPVSARIGQRFPPPSFLR